MSGWEKSPDYGSSSGWGGTLFAVCVFALLTFGLVNCARQGAEAQAQGVSQIVGVASVVDGDTIEIHGQRIRLFGYDTPERGARCGDVNAYQRASLALSDFIGTRTVTCVPSGTDSNNRVVAICRVGNTELGDHMVSAGWGRDWPRYSRGAYADEEASARAARRGLWGLQCPANLWGERDYSR